MSALVLGARGMRPVLAVFVENPRLKINAEFFPYPYVGNIAETGILQFGPGLVTRVRITAFCRTQ
jgi:hypothetical protein